MVERMNGKQKLLSQASVAPNVLSLSRGHASRRTSLRLGCAAAWQRDAGTRHRRPLNFNRPFIGVNPALTPVSLS